MPITRGKEGLPSGLVGKERIHPQCLRMQVRSLDWEDLPEEENGNPLQHSCLENPVDRGGWQATVHRVAKSWK